MTKLFKKLTRTYRAGEVIFEEGSYCDGIYSIQSGQVLVYKQKATPEGPFEIELGKLGVGSMFGEMGMLDKAKRDASVKALETTEVMIITQAMFEAQLASLPPWIVNFIKILNARLRVTNEKLAAAVQQLDKFGKPPAA